MHDTSTIEPQSPADSAIIWIHGLGADGQDLHPIAQAMNLPSTRHLFPNAPQIPVTINNNLSMPAWFDITNLDQPREIGFDVIEPSIKRIHEIINAQIKQGMDPERIFLVGFSQGGSVALATTLCIDLTVAGVAGLSTFFPEPTAREIQLSDANKKTPIFIAHGEHDQVLSLNMGYETWEMLKKHNYNASWHKYDMGHEITIPEVQDLRMWIMQTLNAN
jgi:phospholipase/carboxylesterase